MFVTPDGSLPLSVRPAWEAAPADGCRWASATEFQGPKWPPPAHWPLGTTEATARCVPPC